jgi:hypothetical protein
MVVLADLQQGLGLPRILAHQTFRIAGRVPGRRERYDFVWISSSIKLPGRKFLVSSQGNNFSWEEVLRFLTGK